MGLILVHGSRADAYGVLCVDSEVDFSTISMKRSALPMASPSSDSDSDSDWKSTAGTFLVKTLKLAQAQHQNRARQDGTALTAPTGNVKFSNALLAWRTALVASYIGAAEL